MKKEIQQLSVFAWTLGLSATSLAGGLNFPPLALDDVAVARSHSVTTGDVLYFFSQGGTGVAPNFSGSFGSNYHTRVGGDLFDVVLTCSGDGLDASGNPAPYEEDIWASSHIFSWFNGVSNPTVTDRYYPSCNITIGNTGQVVDGWANGPAFPGGGGSFVVSSFLYDSPRVAVTFAGGTCPLTGQPLASLAQATRAALFDQLDQGNSLSGGDLEALVSGFPLGCTIIGVERMALGECDTTFDAAACAPMPSKAVPVPFFAFVSTAVGIFITSYLTRRRRTNV